MNPSEDSARSHTATVPTRQTVERVQAVATSNRSIPFGKVDENRTRWTLDGTNLRSDSTDDYALQTFADDGCPNLD